MNVRETRYPLPQAMRSSCTMKSLHIVAIAWFFCFWVFTASVNAGEVARAATPVKAWDGIVSCTLFHDIADFKLDVRQEAGERIYTFLAKDESGELALSVAVAIAPVGSRLPYADFQEAVAAAEPATRKRDFPEIGARARSGYSILPRWSDQWCDVRDQRCLLRCLRFSLRSEQ